MNLRGAVLRTILVFAFALLAIAPLSAQIAPNNQLVVPHSLIVTQIYTGAGNSSTSPYDYDFVEIMNAGPVDIDLAGWALQYETGSDNNQPSTQRVFPLGMYTDANGTARNWLTATGKAHLCDDAVNPTKCVLKAGQYLLIKAANKTSSGLHLPMPVDWDLDYSVTGQNYAMAGTSALNPSNNPAGKLALVKSYTGFPSCTAPVGTTPGPYLSNNAPFPVDFVGYSREGTVTAIPITMCWSGLSTSTRPADLPVTTGSKGGNHPYDYNYGVVARKMNASYCPTGMSGDNNTDFTAVQIGTTAGTGWVIHNSYQMAIEGGTPATLTSYTSCVTGTTTAATMAGSATNVPVDTLSDGILGTTTITVNMSAAGANPASNRLTQVFADLTSIGGTANTLLSDDGKAFAAGPPASGSGDATAGDGTYTVTVPTVPNTANQTFNIPITAIDDAGRTVTPITVQVVVGTSGTAPAIQSCTASPTSFVYLAPGAVTVTCVVTPGSPDAGSVAGDMTAIGGLATQSFMDAGPDGSGHELWTYSGTASTATAGAISLGTITATNGIGDSSVSGPQLTVLPAAPVANAQSVTVSYNSIGQSITLSATGTGTLTYAVATQPTNGGVMCTGASCTYIPTANYSGTDSFTFTATDSFSQTSAPATVSITVSAPSGSDRLVLTQVYVTANSSPAFPDGYVEVFNAGQTTVDLTDWTITLGSGPASAIYIGPHGTFVPAYNANFPQTVTADCTSGYCLAPGQYFLVEVRTKNSKSLLPTTAPTITPDLVVAYWGTGSSSTNGNAPAITDLITPAYVGALSQTGGQIGLIKGTTGIVTTLTNWVVSGGAAVGATSFPIMTGTGAPASNDTFKLTGDTTTYTVTAFDSGTGTLTFTPALATSPADQTALTFTRGDVKPGNPTLSDFFGYKSGSGSQTSYLGSGPFAAGSVTSSITFLRSMTNVCSSAAADNATDWSSATIKATGWLVHNSANTYDQSLATTGYTPSANACPSGSQPPVPVASGQTLTTPFNTALPIILTATNSPTSGSFTQPTNGKVTGTPPNVTYTPATDYVGSDSFTFTATNAGGTSDPATISITVSAPAVPVITDPGALTTAFNTAKQFTLAVSNNPTSYAVTAGPMAGATVTCTAATGACTYTPKTDYAGADSFTVTFSNAGGTSAPLTVNITVDPGVPVITDPGALTTAFATAKQFTLAVSNSPTSYAVTAGPMAGATVTCTAETGACTYTPKTDYAGADSFTVTFSNAGGTSAPLTVNITVNPPVPVASPQTLTTAFNTAKAITLVASNSPTSWVYGQPSNGKVAGTAPDVIYTPTDGFVGTDSFTFTATNVVGISDPATITITVNPAAPVAVPQTLTTAFNTALPITLSATNSPTSWSYVSQPNHGTLTGTAPNVIYTPTMGFSGADLFTFTASNAGGTSPSVTIDITVNPAVPVITDPGALTTAFNTAKQFTLAVSNNPTSSAVTAGPMAGATVTCTAATGACTYTPKTDYAGADSFTVTFSNAGGTSAPLTVNITVNPAAPVITDPGALTTAFNTAKQFTLSVSNSPTSSAVTVGPMAGATVTCTAATGACTYTPKTGYAGADSFAVTFSNAGGTSAPLTVNITVSAQLVPVITDPGALTTAFNTAKQFTLSVSNSPTSFAVTAGPMTGATVTCTAATGACTYTPKTGYAGADSFAVTFSNAGGTSAPLTVNITVSNPAVPVANTQSVTVSYNTAKTVTLSATGTGTLTYTVVTPPAHGNLSGTAPNLTYTPTSNYAGADSFTFKATDSYSQDSTAVAVSITVNGDLTWAAASGGSTTASVAAGGTAVYNLQVSGWTGATGAIAFTCSGAPSGATCTVSPNSSTLNGTTPIAIAVSVKTTGSTGAAGSLTPISPSNGSPWGLAFALTALLAALLVSKKTKMQWQVTGACAALLMVVALSACGSGNSQVASNKTPTGSYTVTVTGTAGNVTKTMPLTLNVQ